MSKRYSRLFSLPENLYAKDAPVLIAAGALLKDNQTGQVLAQLKFRSISPKEIKAVRVKVTPFDTLNRSLGDAVDFQYLDLNISRDTEFGQKTAIPLPDATTRAMAAVVTEVAFDNNTAWCAGGENWEPLTAPISLSAHFQDSEMVKQYRLKYGTNMTYLPTQNGDLWYCSCGALNQKDGRSCHKCGSEYARLAACDENELRKECEKRLEEEERIQANKKAQEEKEQQEASRKAKKHLMIAMVVLLIFFIGIVGYTVVDSVIIPARKYSNAVALMENGQYAEASYSFAELNDYKDSSSLSIYNEGLRLYNEAKYAEAYEYMTSTLPQESVYYEKICSILKDTVYQKAVEEMNNKNYGVALSHFSAITSYMDANEKFVACIEKMVSSGNADEAYASLAKGNILKHTDESNRVSECIHLCESIKDDKNHELEPILTLYVQIENKAAREMISNNNAYIEMALGLNGVWKHTASWGTDLIYKIENGKIDYWNGDEYYDYHALSIKGLTSKTYTFYTWYLEQHYSEYTSNEAIFNYKNAQDNEISIGGKVYIRQ